MGLSESAIFLSTVLILGSTYDQAPMFLCSSCTQANFAFGYRRISCFTRSNGNGEI
ncbi:hypothetical protein DPMN_024577 [Dreissena polymorpha]|uniref:Uncharacterized protein n=1 Tax=Dreissena polymorpha TaxID=45954 RepID=A0A9D4RBR3_DREPO|nr:hypothetical protein DPMN_024577 [Dreissena polymorpha]